MHRIITISLITAASALTSNNIEHALQKPLLSDACPSNSMLHDGICQSSILENISFHRNISQPHAKKQRKHQFSEKPEQKPESFPWTYWPECYTNENTTEPLCVFSDDEFANGRGIFLVTTPEQAHDMLNKPAFSDESVLERINNHANPPFELREMPGKGRGLIANKTLHRGDQIFASTPLLITDPDTYQLVEDERIALHRQGVKELPFESQKKFWGLLDHFKGDPVEDRINTNAFEISIDDHMYHAVLPEIAMMNHDCRPNAAYFWDEETLSHYVHATQTIYPSEEITITYIDNERSRDKRVHNLQRNWGFQCSCSSCSAHPEFVAESDKRLEEMEELAELLNDWTSKSTATPAIAESLISLFEQERLYANLGAAYKHAAEVHSSFGDRWNAVKYARLSIEYNMLDKGFADSDVRAMKTMATNPEMSWSWKKRVGLGNGAGCGCGRAHAH